MNFTGFPPSDKSFGGVQEDALDRVSRLERRRTALPPRLNGGGWGTTAQRDNVFGVPASAGDQAALANRRVTWFNTDLGWWESYYATTGTSGLTAPGLRSGSASGWYPMAGSPLYATLRNVTNQAYSGAVDILFANPPVVAHGIVCTTTTMTLPNAGDWEYSATIVSAGAGGGFVDLRLVINGAQVIAQTGAQFPHTNAYSRADIVPCIFPTPAGAVVKLTATPSGAATIQGTSAYLTTKYISPPFA